jgi:uncharacterized membrane protein
VTILILGLIIFLLPHSVRIFADGWRTAQLTRLGEGPYKGIYSVVSILGFALICWGFGLARQQPVQLWSPPYGMRHLAALLTLIAFVLVTAAYVPRNSIKARLHHPMILGVKSWAVAHLLANGNLAHVVLFGAFLAWGVVNFIAARKRDRSAGTQYPSGAMGPTIVTVLVGVAAWAVFALWAHGYLIGVKPMG